MAKQAACLMCKNFPWVMTTCTLLLIAAAAVNAAQVRKQRKALSEILDTVNTGTSTAAAFDNVLIALAVLVWAGILVALVGTISTGIIKCVWAASRRDLRDQKAEARRKGCLSFLTSRVFLNGVFVLSYLATATVVVVVVVHVLFIAGFAAVDVVANLSQDVFNRGVEIYNDVTTRVAEDLSQAQPQIAQSVATLDELCSTATAQLTTACSEARAALISVNDTLTTQVEPLVDSLALSPCPPNCLNTHDLWFVQSTDGDSCICGAETLQALQDSAKYGARASLVAAIVVAVAFFVWLLFYGVTGMNAKGFVKDRHWSAHMAAKTAADAADAADLNAVDGEPLQGAQAVDCAVFDDRHNGVDAAAKAV